MSVTTIGELGEVLALELNRTQQQILLALRGFANEAGMAASRAEVGRALAAITEKQEAVAGCREAQRAAKDDLKDAIGEATWEIESKRLVVEGPRTRWWVTDEDETETDVDDDGTAIERPTGQKRRISVTADRAKELLAEELRKHPAVRAAQRAVDQAVDATQTAQEAVESAERRFRAALADVAAATAQLSALASTLPLVLQESNR
jgi:hypothetical protein